MRKILLQMAACLLAIFVVLLVEKYTPWDVALQNHFYDFNTGDWFVTKERHEALSPFFYSGFKIFVGVICVICLAGFIVSFFRPWPINLRRALIIMAACILVTPALVAGAKKYTNVCTPLQLSMYGGDYPYVPILSPYPDHFVQEHKARGFPAGHATSGFCLMALYFCFRSKRRKLTGLALGISLGWVAGMYQTLRGEHFVSHTMVSMFASWIVILLTVACIDALFTRLAKGKPSGSGHSSLHSRSLS